MNKSSVFGLLLITIIGGLCLYVLTDIHLQKKTEVIENPGVSSPEREKESVDQEEQEIQTPEEVLTPCPKETQSESLDLFPISRTKGLGEDYTPATLVPIKGAWATYCIKEEVALAYLDMKKSAEEEGLLLDIYSGYRSYQKQQSLYSAWKERNPEPTTYPAVAKPGFSEHQLGTTIDIRSLRIPYHEPNPLETTEEYTWLKDNAHLYGFVQSYPKDKESVTGYIPEPWHWRYVGVEVAGEIKKQGTTITEYLVQ